ncbi:MAG: hypothetical protein IJK62_06460 [Bacteroidales bacterium]|nr:hypothetical protein [Bacteroidales bacterium]
MLRYFCFLQILECLHSKGIAENKNENVAEQVFYFFARTPAAAQGICNPPYNVFHSFNSKGIAENKNENAAEQVFYFFARTPAAA